MTQYSGLAHLAHHDVHWEYCWNFEERLRFIVATKPAIEIPERRKWFRLIPSERLSPELQKAMADIDKANADFDKGRADWVKAMAAYAAYADFVKAYAAYAAYAAAHADFVKALNEFKSELELLHAELFPGCPWNEKQHTMFPKKERRQ